MKGTLFRAWLVLGSAALVGCSQQLQDQLQAMAEKAQTPTTESKADTTDTTQSKPKLNSIHLSDNQLAILGENLDAIKDLKIEGVSLKIVSQSKSSIAAEALQALKLVLGATHDLIFTTAYAEERVPIYVEMPSVSKKSEEGSGRIVIKDDEKVVGYFLNSIGSNQSLNTNAAIMLPSKEIVVISLISGKFEKIPYIYFADANCSGNGFVDGKAGGTFVGELPIVNRIFVTRTSRFFKVVDAKEATFSYNSYIDGDAGCRNSSGSKYSPHGIVQSMDPIPDFSTLAPIKLDLE